MIARAAKGRSEITVVGDNDEVGRRGATELADALALHYRVKVIFPPVGVKDLRAWLLRGLVGEEFQRVIDGTPIVDLRIESGGCEAMTVIRVDFRPNRRGARKGAVAVYKDGETTPLVCDTFDIASEDKRTQFVSKVTEAYSAVPAAELAKALLEKAGEALKQQDDGQSQDEPNEADPLSLTPPEVIEDAMGVLRSPNLFDQILADIGSMGLAGEDDLKLTVYVVMTSRRMDKPLSAIVQGASSSGKSYTIETVAKLMPAEAVVQAHDFTDQALYYLPVGSLVHKVVVSGERVQEHRGKDGQVQDNSKAFREMVGSGVLSTSNGARFKGDTRAGRGPSSMRAAKSATWKSGLRF